MPAVKRCDVTRNQVGIKSPFEVQTAAGKNPTDTIHQRNDDYHLFGGGCFVLQDDLGLFLVNCFQTRYDQSLYNFFFTHLRAAEPVRAVVFFVCSDMQ